MASSSGLRMLNPLSSSTCSLLVRPSSSASLTPFVHQCRGYAMGRAARVSSTGRAKGSTTTAVANAAAAASDSRATTALFKTFKPITPGLRHVRQPMSPHLWKGGPIRDLTKAKRNSGGRNDTGRITVRGRGGGHKRRIRLVDFKREKPGEQVVQRIEYDPGRSAHIALIKHRESGELSYILAPEGLREGDVVQSFRAGVPDSFTENLFGASADTTTNTSTIPLSSSSGPTDPSTPQSVLPPQIRSSSSTSSGGLGSLPGLSSSQSPSQSQQSAEDASAEEAASSLTIGIFRSKAIKPGNVLPIHLIPVGTRVHCISLRPNSKFSMVRSAGTFGQIVSTSSSGSGGRYAQIKLSSGEVRLVSVNCCATVGSVSNPNHQHRIIGKAGRNRWLGWRPKVRGVAMNSVDHPHGGGRGKSKGNKHPRTPWGKLTKGKRTRRPGPGANTMVVRERPRGKDKRL